MNQLAPDFETIEYCVAAAFELNKRVTSFSANDLAKILTGFMRLHFHPSDECLRRIVGHACDLLIGDEILQEQCEKEFIGLKKWTQLRGFKAEAELEEIDDPHHFTKRKLVRTVTGVMYENQHPEDPKFLKKRMEKFTGEELAALLFALAQLGVKESTGKFFDFVKEEILREAVSLNVRCDLTFQKRCNRSPLSCLSLCGLWPLMNNWIKISSLNP